MKQIMKFMIVVLLALFMVGCAKTVEVTFDADNGTESVAIEVEKGQTVTKPEDPVKEGYFFNFWTLNGNEYDFTRAVEADTALKADYTKLHIVTFKVGDNVIDTRTVKDGDTVAGEVSLPIPEDKKDYDFMGWQYNGADYDIGSPVTGDMELVANYRQRVYVKSIKPANNTITLEMNKTGKVEYTLTPENATETPAFRSENEKIVTVDAQGNLTPVAVGQTNVVLKTANTSAKVKVIVAVYPESITLDKKTAEIEAGNTVKLTVQFTPSNTTVKTITFTTSDKSVATVNENGTVTGQKPGKATITATTANGKKATCEVTVTGVDVTGIAFDKSGLKVAKGNTANLKVSISPANATDQAITYTSSHPEIAAIDSNGKITAKAKGTTTIVATSANGKTATCDVEVFIAVESIAIKETRSVIAFNGEKTTKVHAVISPADADIQEVTWNPKGFNNGKEEYCTLSKGQVNTATIIAQEKSQDHNNISVTASVTNPDGSVVTSNEVYIYCEPNLVINKDNDDERLSSSIATNWVYRHLTEMSINTNINATFEYKDTYVAQDQVGENYVVMTLYNTSGASKYFTLTVKTEGGQSKEILVNVYTG